MVYYLTQKLGWSPKQLQTRPQWRVPRLPSAPSRKDGFPVDVAIFDSPDHLGSEEHVRILVECKEPDADEGIRQLKTYLSLEPEARVGIWFNGTKHRLVYKLDHGFVVNDFAPLPRPTDPLLPTKAKEPIRFRDLVPPPRLGEIFSRLRDQIAAQDSHVNRDEFILNDLANLLICKISEEQAAELKPDRVMAFQQAATPTATATAIRNLFTDTREKLRSVFVDESDRLHLDDTSIENVVKTLQPYRLTGHDRHAVGDAFQVLRGKAAKGEEGAYFTPPALVDCVVSITDPGDEDRCIDPACGTGGFLAATLDHVFEKIDQTNARATAKADAQRRWAAQCLFAVDKDAVSVKLCKAYLTLLGDGRAHAYRANAVDRNEWANRTDDLKREITDGAFDLLTTNPPFGQNLVLSPEIGAAEKLLTCTKWTKDERGAWHPSDEYVEQQIGIAFFERGMNLLKKGGRMAIVLPETFLFSLGFRWFVDWVCRSFMVTHVVDVPMVAFEEFCRAKTCILFVTKETPPPGHKIVMSYPQTIGQDKKGTPLRKIVNGERTGELENEMADAVQLIVGATYNGTRRTAKVPEARLRFHVPQSDVLKRAVLIPRYWWRKDTDAAMAKWTKGHPSKVVTLGELEAQGVIKSFAGHGSPPGNARKTGNVPYVKVSDLRNWRINENPTNFIHEDVAASLRKRGPALQYGDLISPARASANIGQFCIVLPWQKHVVLTREVLGLRVLDNDQGIDAFLLLALLSLCVVQDQYAALTPMHTNREDLGDRWREVRIPLPESKADRDKTAKPVRGYFEATVKARESYDALLRLFGDEALATRP